MHSLKKILIIEALALIYDLGLSLLDWNIPSNGNTTTYQGYKRQGTPLVVGLVLAQKLKESRDNYFKEGSKPALLLSRRIPMR
jgi:uncharacterized metal-binding protein